MRIFNFSNFLPYKCRILGPPLFRGPCVRHFFPHQTSFFVVVNLLTYFIDQSNDFWSIQTNPQKHWMRKKPTNNVAMVRRCRCRGGGTGVAWVDTPRFLNLLYKIFENCMPQNLYLLLSTPIDKIVPPALYVFFLQYLSNT